MVLVSKIKNLGPTISLFHYFVDVSFPKVLLPEFVPPEPVGGF